ncbi:hypothetical protein LTR78_001367 [Recurvomyces mirabilis]|uniref:Major facilitator superfamily (MFS) profile domain-containing protein n=1 Tax=Recurvomyces mirabilis TaxID=574656 RepID=A0AAE1C5J5_9PEZI|nr:hypothetical protein LTR78_001367 [Recurvomyces mirabilis]KAK5161344.1 hypothetical protein LTS14_001140 [Recurvomyces mirabilis]
MDHSKVHDQPHTDGTVPHSTDKPHHGWTGHTENPDAFRAEEESIMEAIEVDSPVASIHQVHESTDLEKSATKETQTTHEPVTRTMTAQDWSGPDDPDNPQNWTLFKRAMHIFPIAFLSFAVTAGSSMITPATPEIARHFEVSRTASILSLSLFVLGLGLGPTIAAPLSEKFGRSAVYKSIGPVYMLFIVGSGFTKSFGGLLVCRLLAGMAGGPVLAVGAGTNADLFPPQTRAVSSTFYVMAPFLGPALGPVIGGFAAQFKGYKWTQWCTIFIAIASYAFILPMHETYKKIILKRRAKKLGIAPPPAPQLSALGYAKMLLTITIARPVTMLCTEPIVFFLSLYTAFTFSVLFAFFAAFPYTFESVYHFQTWQYGLTFLGIGIGVLLAAASAIFIDRTVYMKKHHQAVKEGRRQARPEHRLYAAMIGAFGVPVGLFWFAWSARQDVHWIVPVIGGIPFAWGNLMIFVSAALYLIDVYGPMNGASAMAANGLARYGLGAAFPLFAFQMYQRLGIGWATSLLGFISLGLLPIPFVFFKFGPTIRAKSRYETMKFD